MDIWINACRKTVKCSYCGEQIEKGEPCVFGKLWRKYDAEKGGVPRKWSMNFRWHAKRKRDDQCCWLVQALEHLESHPVAEHRGGKLLLIPKEMREERLKILRKRARVMQRLKAEVEGDGDVDAVIRLGSQLEQLKETIAPLGGVPKNWE